MHYFNFNTFSYFNSYIPDLIYQHYTPFFTFHAIHHIPVFHQKFQQISYNKETISKQQLFPNSSPFDFHNPVISLQSYSQSLLFLFLMIRKESNNKYIWKTGSLLFFLVLSILSSMYLKEKPIAKPAQNLHVWRCNKTS